MYIDCNKFVDALKDKGRVVADKVLTRSNGKPKLVVILVGDDQASATYVRGKERVCGDVGVEVETIRMNADVGCPEVLVIIHQLNVDSSVDGILLQLPLPVQLRSSTTALVQAITPAKDVDGLTFTNIGKNWGGASDALKPCTAAGVLAFIRAQVGVGDDLSLAGKLVVIINRSDLVGRPLAAGLLSVNATPVIAHSKTANLAALTRLADVVVVAVGQPGFLTLDMVKPGTLVVDVGINRVDGKLVGDVDQAVAEVADVTPVPGGVGRFTTAELAFNTALAAFTRRFL